MFINSREIPGHFQVHSSPQLTHVAPECHPLQDHVRPDFWSFLQGWGWAAHSLAREESPHRKAGHRPGGHGFLCRHPRSKLGRSHTEILSTFFPHRPAQLYSLLLSLFYR